MTNEKLFQISVADDDLSLLKSKLDDARFPDEIEGGDWAYGVPLSDVKRLVGRWRGGYDWRAHEREINEQLPMFTRDIELEDFGTVNVHYVHKRSPVAGAIPLLFVHGWPGSIIEMSKILPLLTAEEPGHPSFHVVAPSLPGYAWSEAILNPGFHGKNYAELFNKLMTSLGYPEYVTQGGDWGNVLTRALAARYGPKHVKACHTNMALANALTLRGSPITYLKYLLTPYTEHERKTMAYEKIHRATGMGYFFQQATRPQTLGYGLADSPVGLLAWIYEKLVLWADDYPWTDDEVLTWVSIYWFSRAGPAASLRIYYELSKSGEAPRQPQMTVPLGISYFPKELARAPKTFIHAQSNVVFESEHAAGGHFAAYEKPEALVDDLRRMFGKDGSAADIIPRHSGF